MRRTAEEVLARHFPGMTVEQVDQALSDVPAAAAPAFAAAVAYLSEHGGPEAAEAVSGFRPGRVQAERAAAAGRALAEMLQSSLSLEEVSALLGVSGSQVSRWVREQRLYAVTGQGAARRVPRWQFVDQRVLPGMASVVPAVPRCLHPLALAAFMTTPLGELDDVSPVGHLASGGPPEAVVGLLESLAHQ